MPMTSAGTVDGEGGVVERGVEGGVEGGGEENGVVEGGVVEGGVEEGGVEEGGAVDSVIVVNSISSVVSPTGL